MAFLIPENLASRNDIPPRLQTVAKAMRDLLPEDITVWLENHDDKHYLVVLDPAAGVLVVDVPDPRTLGRSTPVDSVETRSQKLNSLLSSEQRLPDGFPTASTIALPTFTRARMRVSDPAADVDACLLEDDFTRDALRDALSRVLGAKPAVRLDDLGERLVRGIVRPEIVISGRANDDAPQLVFRPPSEANEHDIRVLDRQQERLAHDLGAGYRVIRGVAGSGKSLVLTYRARYIAEHFPQRSVLLTCFNVVLEVALREQLKDLANVTVQNIDSLVRDVLVDARRWRGGKNIDWLVVRQEASRLLAEWPSERKYDLVLVDEAQDFDVAGLALAFAALKDDRDDFVVALDGAQNLYRKKARWNPPRPPGVTARGRTIILKRAYRNTREIAELAWQFLQEARLSEFDDDKIDDPTVVVQPEFVLRRGRRPQVLQCASPSAEIDAILDLIHERHGSGVPWSDMVVLFGGPRPYQRRLYYACQERDIPYFDVTFKRANKDQVISCGDVVRAAGFQGLKGLEFPTVFMCGLNQIWDPAGQDDPASLYRLAYVAMTRAMDELVITVSGSGPIGQAVQRAQDTLATQSIVGTTSEGFVEGQVPRFGGHR